MKAYAGAWYRLLNALVKHEPTKRAISNALIRIPFATWESSDVHVIPVDYYSPIPNTQRLDDSMWAAKNELPGVEMNDSRQLSLLCSFVRYQAEYSEFPIHPTAQAHEFYSDNDFFSGLDAILLHCMVRAFRPRLVVEIGSGFSSMISAHAALLNGDTELICVDPYPDRLPTQLPGLSELIRQEVQSLPIDFFTRLAKNDILFIDSSHTAKIGSDVNYLILDVLPQLSHGVIVHIHDIFWPRDYPRRWFTEHRHFWNEQYLVNAFLAFNEAYEIMLCNSYLCERYNAELKAMFPRCHPSVGGGSLWIQRVLGE
jgi:hypothetical protein